jgi:hypothetical protein
LGTQLPAGSISRDLAGDIEGLARATLDNVERSGASLTGIAQDGDRWIVRVAGLRRGLALNATRPERSGDPLCLVAWARCRGDRNAALDWANAYLRDSMWFHGSAGRAEMRRPAARLFRALAHIDDTPAHAYLRAELGGRDPLPIVGTLRFDASATQRRARREFACLVAPIVEPTSRKLMGLYRVFLSERAGTWGRAGCTPNARVEGALRGGLVPLSRGATGARMRDMSDGERAVVAVGLEDGVRAALRYPDRRVFAALEPENLAEIALPEAISDVLLLTPAREAAVRWGLEGRQVHRRELAA